VSGVLAVVLSYNGRADTLACLDSLAMQDCPSLRVLVVDNASRDESVAAIRQAHPGVELIALDENLGWAGGNNVGIRWGLERGYDLICLLNNDLVLPPTALRVLAETYRRVGDCLLTPALYYFDQPSKPQLDPAATGLGQGPVSGTDTLWRLDYAYGACLMVGAALFRQLGLFDERYFLQLEETDFYYRAAPLGYVSYCETAVRGLHKESASFGGRRTPLKTHYAVRNTLLLALKQGRTGSGLSTLFLKRLYWQIHGLRRDVAPDRSLVGWLVSADPFAVAVRHGAWDFICGRFGRIPL
jgi:GT2 family glycosyltransferase